MSLKPHEQELHAPHRAALLRIIGAGEITVRDIARAVGKSERAIYRVLEGEVAGRIWLPRVLAELGATPSEVADVSGLTDAGYVVFKPPVPGSRRGPRELAHAALELGEGVGAVQSLVAHAMSPDSPGGTDVVGSEAAEIRQAVRELHRAAAVLEAMLEAEDG